MVAVRLAKLFVEFSKFLVIFHHLMLYPHVVFYLWCYGVAICLNHFHKLKLFCGMHLFVDVPIELFDRDAVAYTPEQREFALTLYLYGAKAYEYLRQ
jgi:hypothetical protein